MLSCCYLQDADLVAHGCTMSNGLPGALLRLDQILEAKPKITSRNAFKKQLKDLLKRAAELVRTCSSNRPKHVP